MPLDRDAHAPMQRRLTDETQSAAVGSADALNAAGQQVVANILGDTRPEGLLYVAMNKDAPKEARALERGAKGEPVTEIDAAGRGDDVSTAEGVTRFVATLSLDAGRQAQLVTLLQTVASGTARDEARQVIVAYARADQTGTGMRRVVLSGHSDADDLGGDNGDIPFVFFETLAKIFPTAAGQVEHLMLSSCYTGGRVVMNTPKPGSDSDEAGVNYHRMFPNMKTTLGYAGSSPSIATGSPVHIARWESATSGADVTKLDPGIDKGLHKGENVATWSVDEGYKDLADGADEQASEYMERVRNPGALAMVAAYEAGTQVVADPNSGDLKLYYDTLHRALDCEDLVPADRAYTKAMSDRVVRLRYFKDVAEHFASAYASDLSAGYQALGRPVPDFNAMSRKAAVAEAHAFKAASAGSRDSAVVRCEKLLQGLDDLSADVIPFNWV